MTALFICGGKAEAPVGGWPGWLPMPPGRHGCMIAPRPGPRRGWADTGGASSPGGGGRGPAIRHTKVAVLPHDFRQTRAHEDAARLKQPADPCPDTLILAEVPGGLEADDG